MAVVNIEIKTKKNKEQISEIIQRSFDKCSKKCKRNSSVNVMLSPSPLDFYERDKDGAIINMTMKERFKVWQ